MLRIRHNSFAKIGVITFYNQEKSRKAIIQDLFIKIDRKDIGNRKVFPSTREFRCSL